MGRKKNLKGIDEADMELINSKMSYGSEDRGESSYTNCSKALNYKINLKCKNQSQKLLHNLIKSKEITFAIGSPGSGKSFISLTTALELLKGENAYNKIIIMVPTCEASSYLSIGLLPGSYDEKIAPYLEADTYTMEKILNLSGNVSSKKSINDLIKCGLVDFQLVNFARGKSFDNCILLINESENYSKEEMLLLLTRMGDNCKMIISGDKEQMDRKDLKKNGNQCGLMYAVEHLKDMEEVGVVEFTIDDIVRNPLISKIINNWK